MNKKELQEDPTLKTIYTAVVRLAAEIRNEANERGLLHSTFVLSSIADRCPKELERLILKHYPQAELSKKQMQKLTAFIEYEQEEIISMIAQDDATYGNKKQLKEDIVNYCQSISITLRRAYKSWSRQQRKNIVNFTLGTIGTTGTLVSTICAVIDLLSK